MSRFQRTYLLASGAALIVGALLHIASIFGGPDWYAFLGAPDGLVAMVNAGSLRPAISCIAIATVLLVCSAYAYSGAGVIRKLPGLRVVLAIIAAGMIIRGITFIPIAAWQPHLLSGICGKCQSVNAFLLTTSAICLTVGGGLAVGAFHARD